MAEEGLETHELKEQLDEATEHAHGHGAHGAHGSGAAVSWILYLSLSTALLAALAAVASLESGSYANDALAQKNEAVLHQAKASDQWSYYQAKGIKSVVYSTQPGEHFREEAEREHDEQEGIKKAAEDFEKQAEAANARSEALFHVHHSFAQAVTVFQVAIALAAIAALTKRRAMWLVSLATGAGGLFFLLRGFGVLH